MHRSARPRFHSQAGIAIGPILFVVAILAILATAIAAGSSTFTTNASQETARVNATAMLQIGSTLKLGTDRVIGLGTLGSAVTFTGAATTADIFSITGGGLTFPSTALAATPATDTWKYVTAPVTNIGTTAVDTIAVLKVSSAVCDQINKIVNGPTTTPTGFAPSSATWFTASAGMTNWDAGTGANTLDGKLAGCFNAITNSPGTYFYQVLVAN
ncbi:MAG: hypothetical protein K2Q32_03560 [Alphaproteobacteria bacterium]|nr:hypothetical protein [Alphaproteobacteria bacterium]